jgi:hypothetical protein
MIIIRLSVRKVTNWICIIRKLKKGMQCNGQKTKGKRTNNDVQNTMQYTKE